MCLILIYLMTVKIMYIASVELVVQGRLVMRKPRGFQPRGEGFRTALTDVPMSEGRHAVLQARGRQQTAL